MHTVVVTWELDGNGRQVVDAALDGMAKPIYLSDLDDAARADADTMRDERDAARAIAAQVEALQATLQLVQAERDRWHREAGRPLLSRLFRRRAA